MNSPWFAPLIVAGAILGWLSATVFAGTTWLDDLTLLLQTSFLAALRMIIVPLIFFSLLTGILQLRGTRSMGRLGGVTVLYYSLTSAIAISLGLIVVFFIHPWTDQPPLTELPEVTTKLLDADQEGTVFSILNNLLNSMLVNPFTAMADVNILGVLTTAILFGLAAAVSLPQDSKWPDMLSEITQMVYTCARWILTMLPLGLFAIAYQLTGRIDTGTLISLGQFAMVVFGATAVHGLIVLPTLAWLLAGVPPLKLARALAQPMLTALLTSSSAATLPLSMTAAEEKLGVNRNKAAFVLPLGATINMDGTALFEAIAVVFLAYMFSVPLDTGDIIAVFLMTMLVSAGAPGIPSGGMTGLQVILLTVGIPLEAIGLVLLIERPLDTFRTSVNVEGDLIGAAVAEKWS
jgi:Na+/H+-dicarboxylate symporter